MLLLRIHVNWCYQQNILNCARGNAKDTGEIQSPVVHSVSPPSTVANAIWLWHSNQIRKQ